MLGEMLRKRKSAQLLVSVGPSWFTPWEDLAQHRNPYIFQNRLLMYVGTERKHLHKLYANLK